MRLPGGYWSVLFNNFAFKLQNKTQMDVIVCIISIQGHLIPSW